MGEKIEITNLQWGGRKWRQDKILCTADIEDERQGEQLWGRGESVGSGVHVEVTGGDVGDLPDLLRPFS